MYLYALTVKQPTSINKAIYGNFSESKAQEILVARCRILELYRQDESTGNEMMTRHAAEDRQSRRFRHHQDDERFPTLRGRFRSTIQTNKDYILLGTDSGRIVVLQFNVDKRTFEKVHQETYGKTGVRRIVPGQYISADPMGRAFMISAVEKQKFVYIMNRDSDNKLTISSPLEAHKSHTIIYDTCGVDVGHDNPLFAVIESDYGEIDEFDASVITGEIKKNLTFYEMDLGLNHVIRKHTSGVDSSATNVLPGSVSLL
jgi:splicing factor 3B subunit 3